eukprot:TRINITY_DN23821_c0_g1_i1.p1 TRINITY_DN23821_c0_g1~~TRINITY_DN23821_c0_g1_i1.p1  ORF type:complete len:149 (+),score=34.78 TRINITY_DN23821_c0_g1_i1:94-540(+)
MAMNGAPLLQGKPALAGDVSSRGGCFMSLEGWRDEALLRWQHMPSMKKPVFEQEYPRPWSTCLRLILFVVVSVATLVLSGGIYLPREVESTEPISVAESPRAGMLVSVVAVITFIQLVLIFLVVNFCGGSDDGKVDLGTAARDGLPAD